DGQFAAQGDFALKGKDSQFHLSAQATDLLLDRLHWTHKYKQPKLSFAVDAGLTGNHPDNLVGKLTFRNLSFSNDKGAYALDALSIESSEDDEQRKYLQIHSDLLNGTIDGRFSFRTLPDAWKQALATYLPSLIPPDAQQNTHPEATDFRWNFTLNPTPTLSPVLDLPITFYEPAHITGEYNSEHNHVRLNGAFPLFQFGALVIETGKVDLQGDTTAIELHIDGTRLQQKGNKLVLAASIQAMNDSIRSSIRWNNDNQSKDKGKLDFTTRLFYGDGQHPLAASVRVQPSQMVFNDSVWTLSPARIDYREGRVSVKRMEAHHNRQGIIIEGNLSEDPDDQIRASLHEVDLDYIFQSLNLKNVTLGGIATGYVTGNDLFASRQLTTQLDVRNFSFNQVVFGDLDLNGHWDEAQQGVEMKGSIVRDDTTFIDVNGFIYPVRKELSILFDAHRGNAAFLRKYIHTVAKNFSGEITGKVRLFGHWDDPTVEGTVWVDNGSFEIDFLNARYTFSDWVRMTPDEIAIQNMVLLDAYGNKAVATGSVRHNLFDDFRFSAQISYENFLVFNATPRTNPLFYGKFFGTGTATIRGTEEVIDIDVSLQNNEKTTIALNLMEQPDIVDYDFINFVPKEKPAPLPIPSRLLPVTTIPSLAKANPKTEIRTNLLINANPEATLEVIMDPVTGDKISATGEGTLQIQYSAKTPLRVFGNYRIDRGAYNFSFQQAFFRNFNIEEGSSINFRGDPYEAALNIKAAYTVSANLSDLDQQLVQQTETGHRLSARDNIPVNCVLLLSGPLEQPVIRFDLELPGATAEVERQVKSYIRTDDMMNRQMIYLLLMERFYTAPEYARSDIRSNNDLALLTSTLSSYISTLIRNLTDKFQVGTKIHQTYEEGGTNTEMELLLSSTLLNNRLIINGNFGYIDNPYLNTLNDNVPLIGDFDIEYKLTKSGDIRLKGFNRYNYRNYYSITPEMTQGFGILFRRDFNTLNDLFGKRRQPSFLRLPPAERPVAPADTVKVNLY
ncbi:MAG: translocation/assembly module TamB, partial [Dysgonamonadaceae bacterium]|nr:translocation/assembly module TamB [Dysgonamonadaceae bacterium]